MKANCLFVFSLLLLFCLFHAEAVVVDIPDPNLERVLRDELDKPVGALTDADLATITYLYAGHEQIADLTGIEYCVNLKTLDLYENYVTEITPLAGLTDLWRLNLDRNYITDLTPIANLVNLEDLDLSNNYITDIDPLANLTNLRELEIVGYAGWEGNRITDIGPLANLTKLEELDLWNNQIGDITGITNLTNLDSLELGNNRITNIAPLANLANLRVLGIYNNLVSDIGSLANLVSLEMLNIDDNRISNINALSNLTELQDLWADSNRISSVVPLANLTNLSRLSMETNNIADISPLANLTNLWELDLEYNQISDIAPLANLTRLWELRLAHNKITNIAPLATLINLTQLDIESNQVSNINALAGLIYLTELNLSDNQIVDISSLAGLIHLIELNLSDNQISDISPLVGLIHLVRLRLGGNQIAEINPLVSLMYMEYLELMENQITNIDSLASLTHLTDLYLSENTIVNISALSGLTSLRYLWLSDCQIADLTPLTSLISLHELELYNNQISDIAPLVNNTGLGRGDYVYLNSNPLNEAAYNIHIPALEARGVEVEYDGPDNIPRIEDLAAATGTTGNIVNLSWKAPGNVTTAHRYIVRYNTVAITQPNWDASLDVKSEPPIPGPPGSNQTLAVAMPHPYVIYYFAIRTQDLDGDLSAISNSSSAWSAMPTGEGMDLYEGWNMVAYMGDQPISVQEAMSSMNGKYSAVWTYDASIPGWLRYIVDLPDFLNNLTQMKPGFAYWVLATQSGKWNFGGTGGMSPPSEMRKPPFLLYGKVYDSTDPENPRLLEPATHGDLDICLRVGRSLAGVYVFGSDPAYADYYVMEIPVDSQIHAGDLARAYLDGVLADGNPLTIGDMGLAERHDISYRRVPKSTNLLQNYPNPFNPETWIPFQLSEDSEVEIRIYSSVGRLVRVLDLGFRQAGHYITKEGAAWWDGANEVEEKVAGGVYFYTIRAGKSFCATRKMVIVK